MGILRVTLAFALAGGVLVAAAPAALAAPGNDLITGATTVLALPYSVGENTANATTSPDDPSDCTSPTRSVWFDVTLPATQDVVIDTLGGPETATVGVYTGSPGSLTLTACMDAGGTPLRATLAGGTTYHLMSAGVSALRLHLRAATTPTFSAVNGRFYANPDDNGAIDFTAASTPAFTKKFPVIAFDPPAGLQHCSNPIDVNENTRPFTAVVPQADGTCTKSVAGGNGVRAGVGSLSSFEAGFTGTLSVAAAGVARIAFFSDDGWVLGLGRTAAGAPTQIAGSSVNPPAATALKGFPVVGAVNGPNAASETDTYVSFPGPGQYPFELDYSECCGGELSLAVEADPQRTLTVAADGDGTGRITSSPVGIDCGPTCSASFPSLSQVRLTAAADAGSHLAQWTGCPSASGDTCTVPLSDDTTVVATFLSGPPLAIDGLTPAQGTWRTPLTITGAGFSRASTVVVGGIEVASFTIVSDTTITTAVPDHATTGVVTVVTPLEQVSSTSEFLVTPTVSSFSPKSGPVGTTVTITGTALLNTLSVKLGTTAATDVSVIDDRHVSFTVPAGATSGRLTVRTDGGTARSGRSFTVT